MPSRSPHPSTRPPLGALSPALALLALSTGSAPAAAHEPVDKVPAASLVPTPAAEALAASLNDLRAHAGQIPHAHGRDRRELREELTILVSATSNQLGSHPSLASDAAKSYVNRAARKYGVPKLLRTAYPLNTEFSAQVATIPRGAWRSLEDHVQPVPGTAAPARTVSALLGAGKADAWPYAGASAAVDHVVDQSAGEELLYAVSATRHADAIRDADDGRFLPDATKEEAKKVSVAQRGNSYVDIGAGSPPGGLGPALDGIDALDDSPGDVSLADDGGAPSHQAQSASVRASTGDYARTEVAARADLGRTFEPRGAHRDATEAGTFPGRTPSTNLCLERHDGPLSDPTYTVCLIGGVVTHFQGPPIGIAELPDWRVDVDGETAMLLHNVRYSLGCANSMAHANARTCAALETLAKTLDP